MERIYIQDEETYRLMTDDEFGGYLYSVERLEPERITQEDVPILEAWKIAHPDIVALTRPIPNIEFGTSGLTKEANETPSPS